VGGAQRQAYAGIDPVTKKPYTGDQLRNKFFPTTPAAPTAPTAPVAPTTATATTTKPAAAGKFPGEDPQGSNYVGRREVARRQAARDADAAKKPATPNFGGPTGYASTSYAPSIKTGANLPKPAAAPAAEPQGSTYDPAKAAADKLAKGQADQQQAQQQMAATKQANAVKNQQDAAIKAAADAAKAKSGFQQDASDKLAIKTAADRGIREAEKKKKKASIGAPAVTETRIATALKKPVAEMLQMVETKEDVAKIKQFVDQTFVRYGAVNESAFAVRNQILEHVTQIGAQRRREFAAQRTH